MNKRAFRVALLIVLVAGLGYTMRLMDNAQHPKSTPPPQKVQDTRAKDLARLVDRKTKNWLVDPKLKVVKTGSGLKYQDIRMGNGAAAKPGDTVSVDYVGWIHPQGAIFDDSLATGSEPITFSVGAKQVIKGWDEGVASMKVGGIRRLIIPPNLAYGKTGAPPAIPPNSTLTFMVKLLAVQPGK